MGAAAGETVFDISFVFLIQGVPSLFYMRPVAIIRGRVNFGRGGEEGGGESCFVPEGEM